MEYALLIALVAALVVVGMVAVAPRINSILQQVPPSFVPGSTSTAAPFATSTAAPTATTGNGNNGCGNNGQGNHGAGNCH